MVVGGVRGGRGEGRARIEQGGVSRRGHLRTCQLRLRYAGLCLFLFARSPTLSALPLAGATRLICRI